MLSLIVSIITCLWMAKRLRGSIDSGNNRPCAWVLARNSLKWGMAIVTLPVLGFLGISRFASGQGVPSLFTVILCTGLTSLVMTGTPVEVTGNVIVDSLLVSGVVVFFCLTIVNGVPVAIGMLGSGSLGLWFLACVFVAVVVRAVFWADKGE